ncbi:MAG: bacillithiol biosynthesis deacetylase BshB1 [Gemmatimonadota bacterium]|nr:bacillithiol biosynthesis deacetylase BshB1 [Gemmatimonadota bacterium]MDP6803308.1 bacillithiol biosynthesis deacetylase BshB1 [Gemmatimonadota bacterium]MDP7032315.1 bacillithiol biosynthesis deacetylase BshB1 [Gemmatimonadota bacterium]
MTVLAIGAHPDDVDLYAGGMIAGLVRRGVRVVILDLTRGEMGSRGDADTREEEATAAARALGVSVRECAGLPDGGVCAANADHVRTVVEAIRRHRPRLLLAPFENDPHPDHRETAALVRQACFLSGATQANAAGDPFHPGRVLFYEQKVSFEPDLVVDITEDVNAKRAAVHAFASQFTREGGGAKTQISDAAFHEMLAARELVHGARIGVHRGEGYRLDGPVAVADAVQLLSEEGAP